MSTFLATLLTVCAATQVWVESPLARVFPNTVPASTATAEAKIYAAQGERESFQICIRADKKPVESVTVEAEGMGAFISAPEIRRVGYVSLPGIGPRTVDFRAASGSQQAAENPPEWFPDPLLAFEPFSLAPGETAAVWVTYDISRDAKPGIHDGSVIVRYETKQKRPVKVSLEVFPFVLPEIPSLRTAFPLDRESISLVYGLDNALLEKWKPIYDAFAHERISIRLWEGGDLLTVPKEGPPDTTRIKEHLDYAVEVAHMNSVDIGAGARGIALWPPSPEGTIQDPLQYYLHDMCNWLQDRDWLDRAYIEPMPLPARTKWQNARDAYFRVNRNDKRIKRMLAGVGDPYFERYTDIWTTSVAQCDPYAIFLLQQGLSLSFTQECPAQQVTASSSESLPGDTVYLTQPGDAYDGCLFTYWISKAPPKRKSPQWFQVDLEKPVTTDKIKIIWKRGFESIDIDVQTFLAGQALPQRDVRWQPFPPSSPHSQSWVDVILASKTTFDSVRLEFGGSFSGGPIGITELILGEVPSAAPPQRIEPIEVWLSTDRGSFPSFSIRGHPIEARAMPWVCWGHESLGFLHTGLCQWPEGWAALAKAQPIVWPLEVRKPQRKTAKESQDTAGMGFLFYPGRDAPMPSIRSELLRDGMEDYEYLLSLDQLLSATNVTLEDLRLPDVALVAARRLYAPVLPPQELDVLTQMMTKGRIRMGWAIKELVKKK